jgi:hypothetical protein
MSNIGLRRDFAVWPVNAARIARCLGFVEVLDGRPGVSWGFKGLGGVAEHDEGEIFARCVGQERLDGAEAQRDGVGRVVPLIGHPGQPSFQVLPIEVVETDAVAFDALGVGEVVQVALQTDPICLEGLR